MRRETGGIQPMRAVRFARASGNRRHRAHAHAAVCACYRLCACFALRITCYAAYESANLDLIQILPDLPALALSLLLLGALVGLAEVLHRALGWPSRLLRRLVHAATGLYVVVIPYIFSTATAVYLLAFTFVIVNGVTTARGWLRGMHPEGHESWGTLAFPLALLAVLPFTWADERHYALQTAFLVLAFADPAAAMAGEAFGRRSARIGAARKSLAGSLTFFAVAALLTLIGLTHLGGLSLHGADGGRYILLAATVALVATAVEALGGRGWDNFFIPVAIVATLLLWQMEPERLTAMTLGVVIGAAFSLLAWRMRYLTLGGAIAAGLFAATLVGLGGWAWVLPGFTFFFLSSALSKWAPEAKGAYAEAGARESRRHAAQVYANGGVAWLLAVAYAAWPQAWMYWGFVGSLAAATADTWATEVGSLFRQQPRLLLSGKAVPVGTSGAVTWGGTLVGALGATVIWATAWWTAPEAVTGSGLVLSLVSVLGGGVAGSLIDSLAGATIQAGYRDPGSGHVLDHPPRSGDPQRVRGWRRVDNDVVNALCTAVGAAVAIGVMMAA